MLPSGGSITNGPPPLARGSRWDRPSRPRESRTTPARAGITGGTSRSAPRAADHPRSRGDHHPARAAAMIVVGPPPLARGSLRGAGRQLPSDRTTPARAGITRRPSRAGPRRPDHPRSRGDHRFPTRTRAPANGPPPLARGSPGPGPPPGEGLRTTPARAGITGQGLGPLAAPPDHPRSRGDRLRGVYLGLRIERTTPARAGITPGCSRGLFWLPDHPRSRGDHNRHGMRPWARAGPPPLARGSPFLTCGNVELLPSLGAVRFCARGHDVRGVCWGGRIDVCDGTGGCGG